MRFITEMLKDSGLDIGQILAVVLDLNDRGTMTGVAWVKFHTSLMARLMMWEMQRGWRINIKEESGLTFAQNNVIAKPNDRELLTPFWPYDRQDCDGSLPWMKERKWSMEDNLKKFRLHSVTPNLSFPRSRTEKDGKVILNTICDNLDETSPAYLHKIQESIWCFQELSLLQ